MMQLQWMKCTVLHYIHVYCNLLTKLTALKIELYQIFGFTSMPSNVLNIQFIFG